MRPNVKQQSKLQTRYGLSKMDNNLSKMDEKKLTPTEIVSKAQRPRSHALTVGLSTFCARSIIDTRILSATTDADVVSVFGRITANSSPP